MFGCLLITSTPSPSTTPAVALASEQTLSVNVFYRINHEPPDPNIRNNIEQTRQEQEFKIGSIGFVNSTGILFAAIFAVPKCKSELLSKGLWTKRVFICRRQCHLYLSLYYPHFFLDSLSEKYCTFSVVHNELVKRHNK